MTSIIKVNNIQNQCGQNIINENSNTITIGASGDTIALASGASQTGFGRTGTVDWQTGDIKTANFTAVSGQGFFCNTTSGAFTCNLPAGSAGAIVSVQDYNNTFDSEALTVAPNGTEKINGGQGNVVLNTEGEGLTLVYIDGTIGWRSIQDNVFADTGSAFISATGGTESVVCTNFKVHTFTGPGTFTILNAGGAPGPSSSNVFDYLVIGGGGAGGSAAPSNGAGGGGAGGYRESSGAASGCYTASPLGGGVAGKTAVTGAYPIQVGGGGPNPPSAYPNPTKAIFPGTNSVLGFSPAPITSAAGGGGGLGQPDSTYGGGPGGSGGGGGGYAPGGNTGGTGNTPSVSPAQGFNGGQGSTPPQSNFRGGGGGGASAVGTDGGPGGANGGAGTTSSINGTPTARAGGGGGGCTNGSIYAAGSGGTGGGGDGGAGPGNTADAGTVNTGSGGGGGGFPASPVAVIAGGGGGSGIVIIRYKFQ